MALPPAPGYILFIRSGSKGGPVWRKAAVLPFTVLLTFCGGDDGPQYSEEVRDNFLTSCAGTSGGNDEACECVLNEIEERMSEDEFLELEQKAIDEGQDVLLEHPDIEEAFSECE